MGELGKLGEKIETLALGIDDCTDMLTIKSRCNPLWRASIDNLELPEQPRIVEQIDQNAIKRQCLEVALPEFGRRNLRDKVSRWVGLWLLVEKSINILDQGQVFTTEAFT